jgi:hypothetical protein
VLSFETPSFRRETRHHPDGSINTQHSITDVSSDKMPNFSDKRVNPEDDIELGGRVSSMSFLPDRDGRGRSMNSGIALCSLDSGGLDSGVPSFSWTAPCPVVLLFVSHQIETHWDVFDPDGLSFLHLRFICVIREIRGFI